MTIRRSRPVFGRFVIGLLVAGVVGVALPLLLGAGLSRCATWVMGAR